MKYREGLQRAGLSYERAGDTLTWAGDIKNGNLIVKQVYFNITLFDTFSNMNMGFAEFWKRKIPTKILLFGWLVWRERILTWDMLRRKGFHGPSRCSFCRMEEESISHIFFLCPWTTHLWSLFCKPLLDGAWPPTSFIEAAHSWDRLLGEFRSLPFFFVWEVWQCRKRFIF